MRQGDHRLPCATERRALATLLVFASSCGRIGFDMAEHETDGSTAPDGAPSTDASSDADGGAAVDGGAGDYDGGFDGGFDGGAIDAGPDACVAMGIESGAGCSDGIDNDCDGLVDAEDGDCAQCQVPDADGDGSTSIGCGGDDCADDDGSIRPGAVEVCGDGIDQDCSGADLPDDGDADGSISIDCGGDDCDDSDPAVSPAAIEGPAGCTDGIDNDCDGAVDDSDPGCDCVHPAVTESCAAGWCRIPAGCFWTGSPDTENCRSDAEDRAAVTLTHPFEISQSEVTQAEYLAVTGSNPSQNVDCGLDCPVEKVSWHDSAAYCNALSVAANLVECYACDLVGQNWRCGESPDYPGAAIYDCPGYRLPTEAEWEYAARAGITSATPGGELGDCQADPILEAYAWYWDNARGDPRPVCGLERNGWGLCDMLGNIQEWAHDQYVIHRGTAAVTDPVFPPVDRVPVRGSSCFEFSETTRFADRTYNSPLGQSFDSYGFRVVRTVE